jgi:hypothetical protein
LTVDRGVVHDRGFQSLNFGVNHGEVHSRGFESLTLLGQWWCSSAWPWVRIFDFGGQLVVSAWSWVQILGLFGGQLWCNNHPQNQQGLPNPTQTIAPGLLEILPEKIIAVFIE